MSGIARVIRDNLSFTISVFVSLYHQRERRSRDEEMVAETYQNLGWSSGHIGCDQGISVVLHKHLGGRHPLITWAEYLVHLGHGLCAICERSDCLGPARFEDRRCADKMRDVHHFGRDATVWAGRGGEDDLITASDLCGDTEHECRRG